ncbi:MAG: hypothetical protein VXV87_00930 [Pseudomonadota bacterium]|nr:hypothetical protein [Pseudomonadota bacterium]
MTYWLWMSAGGVALAATVVHGIWGRKIYLGNINAAEMEGLTKSLSAVSWDAFSVQLLVSALTLLYVSNNPDAALIAVPIIIMSFLGAGIFIGLFVTGHKNLISLPGAYLLLAIGVLGWSAL